MTDDLLILEALANREAEIARLHDEIKRLRGLLQWWIDAGPDADWDDYEQRVCEAIRNAR